MQSDKNRQLIERIEKLEIVLILIINQLRGIKGFPQELVSISEKIILNREDK